MPLPKFRFVFTQTLILCALLAPATGAETSLPPAKPADLFQTEAIWSIHLTFTRDQWAGIEPKNDRRGGPGGPGGFGPGNFLAPIFLRGDQDGDGKLSKEEFMALGEKWFGEWDKEKSGRLTIEQVRMGFSSMLGRGPGGPMFPPGGGPPGGPEGDHPPGFGVDFPTVHADLDFNGEALNNVAIRYKGNFTYMASRNQLKRSLKIDLGDAVKGQKLAGVTKLNLHSEVTDPAWMNEALSYRLFRDAGVPSPRTAYARVFLTVPGKYDHQYLGLYALVEEIDKNFAKEQFGTKKGALFKPETRELFADLGDNWKKYDRAYDPKGDVAPEDEQRIIEFARFVTTADDAEFAAKLGDYVDLDEFARFMAVTVWLSNLDSILSMGHNYYLYLHPKTRKFLFLPWDLDLSFGKFNMGGAVTEKLSIRQPWQGSMPFLERVFKVEAFNKLYLERLHEISGTLGQAERFAHQVDELTPILRPAVAEESPEKLARFDKSVAGQKSDASAAAPEPHPPGEAGPPGPPMGGPGGPMSDKPIKTFVAARAVSVENQLAGKSEEYPGDPAPSHRPGGRDGFGPERFLADALVRFFGAKDGILTHDQFQQTFGDAFARWNTDHTGYLTAEQLRTGLGKDFAPR